jgi:protein TonB
MRGIGGGCDEEALRVVKIMPDWKAGKQNGQAVPVYFNLPVKFVLQ